MKAIRELESFRSIDQIHGFVAIASPAIPDCRRDEQAKRIDHVDDDFHDLRDRWSIAQHQAHMRIPHPPCGRKKGA